MPFYLATIEIPVEAKSYADAAIQAHGYATNPENTPVGFRVQKGKDTTLFQHKNPEDPGKFIDVEHLLDREYLLGEITDWSERQPDVYDATMDPFREMYGDDEITLDDLDTEDLADLYVENIQDSKAKQPC